MEEEEEGTIHIFQVYIQVYILSLLLHVLLVIFKNLLRWSRTQAGIRGHPGRL